MKNVRRTGINVLSLVLLLSAAGCATQKTQVTPYFYPGPPSQPRIQYLTSISAPEQVIPPPSAFRRFVLGNPEKMISIQKPYGITLNNGQIFICDTVIGTIHIVDLMHRSWQYYRPGGRAAIRKPINCAVDDFGRLVVTDTLRKQLSFLDDTGNLQDAITGLKPADVKILNGRVYVADLDGREVKVYNQRTLELEKVMPSKADSDDEKLFGPVNLDVDLDGNVYVSDIRAFRIQKYRPDGTFDRSFGRHGKGPGMFTRNKGVAVDHNGLVYVVDAAFNNVQIFNPEGQLLLFFGDNLPDGGAMVLPADITIDYDHVDLFSQYAAPGMELEYLIFVTSQYGPHKVNVFGFIKQGEGNTLPLQWPELEPGT